MLRADKFRLYTLKNPGIFIPIRGYTVFTLVEGADQGCAFVHKFPLMRQLLYAYVPRMMKCYNRMIKTDIKNVRDTYGDKITKYYEPSKLKDKSFYYDLTPYFAYLHAKLNHARFVKECDIFVSKRLEEVKGLNDKTILLYYVDSSMLANGIAYKDLYAYPWIFNLRKQITDLQFEKIFLISKATNDVRLIYDKNLNEKNKYAIMAKWISLACKAKVKSVVDDDLPEVVDIIDKQSKLGTLDKLNDKKINNDIDDDSINDTGTLDNDDSEKIGIYDNLKRKFFRKVKNDAHDIDNKNNKDDIGDKVDIGDNFNIYNKDSVSFDDKLADPKDSSLSADEFELAPMVSPVALKRIVKDLVKQTYNSIGSLEDLSRGTLEKRLYSFLKSTPENTKYVSLVSKDVDMTDKVAVVKAAVSKNPDQTLITPTNEPFYSEDVSKQEEISEELNLNKTEHIDDLHTKIEDEIIDNSIANAIARRHGYQGKLGKLIFESVSRPLEEIGYTVVDVTFTKNVSSNTEIYKTLTEFVNIKVKDPNGNKMTLQFSIPKLTEDRYILSGGLRWFYPTIMSTLPIFIIKPHEVQLRTNYSSIRFTYGVFNRRVDIQCYVGGFKIPYTLLLSCYFGLEGMLNLFGFRYLVTDNNDRIKDPNIIVYKLQNNKRLLVYKKDNTAMTTVILSGLQMMFRKYQYDDISKVNESFECLKAYTKVPKSEYILRQVFKYIIDVHTKNVLESNKMPTMLKDIIIFCGQLSLTDMVQDRLDVKNSYLRTTDIIVAGVEKGIQSAVSIYKQRHIYDPSSPLSVNSAFVINFFRQQGVLQMLQDQNPIEEISNYAAVRIVGPGGLPNIDAVMSKDRSVRMSHFGNIDPVDTSEGDPGTRLFLSVGHMYDDEQNSFMRMEPNSVNTNILGPAASLTPYADKNDQARLIMASNQARQAVPIISSEVPYVMSGFEAKAPALTSSTFNIRATKDGKVEYTDDNVIIVDYDGEKEVFNIQPKQLKSGSGLDSAITIKPLVKENDDVKKGDLLAVNQYVQPVLTQGLNVPCCYLSYNGYNYEDGVVISESLSKKLTSLHYDTIEIEVSENDELAIFPQIGQEFEKGDVLVQMKKNIIGGTSLSEDYDVVAPSKVKIVDINVYPYDKQKVKGIVNQIDQYYKNTNDILREKGLPLIFDKDKILDNAGKYTAHGEKINTNLIIIKLIRYMPVTYGDKLTNRHAAKGVVVKILPDSKMPVSESGVRVDIVINALSVISRMNTGQLHELGLCNVLYTAQNKLRSMIDENTSRIDIEEFITTLYSMMDATTDKSYSSQVSMNVKSLSDKDFNKLITDIAKRGFHVIQAPFQSINSHQLKDIAEWVGAKLSEIFYLPELGSDVKTKNPVAWGYIYMYKLEHISEHKVNARNVGKYIKTTLEPTRGKARAGGQRMGELDTWCLLSYDAKTVLKDFWVVNGDNPDVKRKVLSDIYHNGFSNVDPNVERSGAGQYFDSLLVGMCVDPNS